MQKRFLLVSLLASPVAPLFIEKGDHVYRDKLVLANVLVRTLAILVLMAVTTPDGWLVPIFWVGCFFIDVFTFVYNKLGEKDAKANN